MERVKFADNLRGAAAVLVVISHLGGLFWLRPDVIHALLQVKPGHTEHVGFLAAAKALQFHPLVDYGALGVALFFLISGFVIPFSLERLSRGGFAVARCLRIFPTYWAALAVTLTAVFVAGRFLNGEWTIGPGRIALQALLVRDWAWMPPLDAVSWSLEIELKFYLLALVAAGILRSGRWLPLGLFVSGLAGLSLLVRDGADLGAMRWALVLQYDLPIIVFMFIGTVFNFHFRGKIGHGTAAALIFYFLMLTLVTIGQSVVLGSILSRMALNYGIALVLFTACYYFRDRIPTVPGLGFLARISYPLYAVHAVPGFVLLEYALNRGLPVWAALPLTLATIGILAWLLHLLIERPTMRLGHVLAAKIR